MTDTKQPAAKFRDGVLAVTVWPNQHTNEQGEVKTFYSFNFEKRYKDGEEWKTSSSYNAEDALKISSLMQQVHIKMLELKQA